MRRWTTFSLASVFLSGFAQTQSSVSLPDCRCVPDEACWPNESDWDSFNAEVGGKLIKTSPVADSCYDGPEMSEEQCKYVREMWTDHHFQTSQPLGRWYPYNMTCKPDDGAGKKAASCTLGQLPVYAVDVAKREDIQQTLKFARDYNIRVSVINTGHDLIGRADGFGSLAIWMRNFRNSITFHEKFESVTQCRKSNWSGNTIHIDGAWQWGHVNQEAKKHNVIVVSSSSRSPGATGGWLSGGGHGPASRNYGLGADQLLEAEVMLADGNIVIANHCQYPDLFRALRGGGPGYGIVVGTIIKAYPNVDVVTSWGFKISPVSDEDNTVFLDAVSIMSQLFPTLGDLGFAGYAVWFPTLFNHSLWTIGKGRHHADTVAAFDILRSVMAPFEDLLNMVETFREYQDYWSFYESELHSSDVPGDTMLVTSRMWDRKSVLNYESVRPAIEKITGDTGDMTLLMLVSGGQVFQDAADKSSGLNPAWRTCPMVVLATRKVPRNATAAQRQDIADDVTKVKGVAAQELAPDTGSYMNEGDRNDADYMENFYGSNIRSHREAKEKYDPDYMFYCPTCVGADKFRDWPDGPLCRIS